MKKPKKIKLKKYLSKWMDLDKEKILQVRIDKGKGEVKVITIDKPCFVDITLITGEKKAVKKIVKN